MKKYQCQPCGWIYDPAVGDPDGGIAPGTPFEEIPDDWCCPMCGASSGCSSVRRSIRALPLTRSKLSMSKSPALCGGGVLCTYQWLLGAMFFYQTRELNKVRHIQLLSPLCEKIYPGKIKIFGEKPA